MLFRSRVYLLMVCACVRVCVFAPQDSTDGTPPPESPGSMLSDHRPPNHPSDPARDLRTTSGLPATSPLSGHRQHPKKSKVPPPPMPPPLYYNSFHLCILIQYYCRQFLRANPGCGPFLGGGACLWRWRRGGAPRPSWVEPAPCPPPGRPRVSRGRLGVSGP